MLDRLDPLGDPCDGIGLPAELRDLGHKGRTSTSWPRWSAPSSSGCGDPSGGANAVPALASEAYTARSC
jgi:hypothetical protein